MSKIISDYVELHVYAPAEKKYLLLKRAAGESIYPGIWQMITARCEKNETVAETALRELSEEAGLNPSALFVIPRVNTFYIESADSICLSPVFLALTDETEVTISDEHTEFRWVSFEEAVELIHWENQVESLRMIEKYLGDEKLFEKLVEVKT